MAPWPQLTKEHSKNGNKNGTAVSPADPPEKDGPFCKIRQLHHWRDMDWSSLAPARLQHGWKLVIVGLDPSCTSLCQTGLVLCVTYSLS
eukprot:15366898-Ditylum_brightwellii.AAC.1